MTRGRPTRRGFLRGTGGAVVGGGLLPALSRSSVRAQSGESWPQFRYDIANTGHAPTNTGPVANIEQQWTFETDGDVESSPAVVDGTVYVGSRDNSVYAVDAADGTQQWAFETDDSVESSPAVVDGTVYVGSRDGNLYALDAADGTQQWAFGTDDLVSSSPAVVDGTVYVGIGDGELYALDAADGTQQWTFATGGAMQSSPAVVDGTVYVGSADGSLYAVDAASGDKQWTFETGWKVYSSPAVVDGTIYVGSGDNNLYAVSAASGAQQWAFETGWDVRSSPAVVDGIVYVGSRDSSVYAVSAASGDKQWTFETGDRVESSPAVMDDTVYVGSDDGHVYAVDAADGTQQWTVETGGGVWSSPAVVDGTVYVGSDDGNLYAVTGETSPPTPTPDSSETSTSTPAPDSSETKTSGVGDATGSQDDTPGLPMILGALGATGAGAWWYSRRGGSRSGEDRPAGGGSTSGGRSAPGGSSPAAGGSADTATASESEPSADSGPVETVTELLAEGDDHRANAGDFRAAGEYDPALAAYDDAQEAYETARERASQTDLIDTDEINQRLAAVQEERQETYRQRLQTEVEALRSELAQADTLADEDSPKNARERLTDLESRLASAKHTATQHDFEDLHGEIESLERRREARLTEVTEQLQAHPVPGEIPRAPDVSVDYDTLTDEEPIGGGGNADVSKATLPTPGGDVTLAIKRPRMSGTLHTDQVERMLQEAETWDKLDDHDHIVGVVDYGSEPIPWIAMEYMDGGHLGEHSGELPVPQALWTALAVTKGVRHAHRRGIAHLDLKPQNVLFRTIEDAWDVPKVADWGLSKHLLDHSKSVEGMSVEYAAPEQFTDEYGSADDITDIYQLGAVFYELFTGHPPFEGQPFKVIDMIKSDRPTPPSEIADVPEALDEILLTALAKEKPDRYDDIVYLRDDLQELFDNW